MFGGNLFNFSSAITAFCLHLVTIEVRMVSSRIHSFGVVFKCPVMILPANLWAFSSFSKLVLESQGCQAAPALSMVVQPMARYINLRVALS